MDLTKIGKARELLMESENAKEALVDAFSQVTMTDEKRNKLFLIEEIASFCEREEMEITLAGEVISSLLRNGKPAAEDVMKILDILTECQHDLKDYIAGKIHPSISNVKQFSDYYSAISEHVKMKEKRS